MPAEQHGLAEPPLGPAGQRHRAAGASGLRGTAPKLQEKEEKKPFLTPHPDGNKDGKQPPEPRGREKPPSRRTTKPHKGLRAGLLSPPPPPPSPPPR